MNRKVVSLFQVLFTTYLLAKPLLASATWSIIAVDSATQEVGIAGASCYPGSAVIAAIVPGKGVVTAQGLTSIIGRDYAVSRLLQGDTAARIIEAVRSSEVDEDWFFYRWMRQYGIVSLNGNSLETSVYTGALTLPYRGSRQGDNFSAQGNVLRDGVLDEVYAAFTASFRTGSLANALLVALKAGSSAGGDRRCSQSQTALSAFLIVAKPEDQPAQPAIHLIAPDQLEGGANPVDLLLDLYQKSIAENGNR